MSAEPVACTFTFKKSAARRCQTRKRKVHESSGDESSADETQVVRAARASTSTGGVRSSSSGGGGGSGAAGSNKSGLTSSTRRGIASRQNGAEQDGGSGDARSGDGVGVSYRSDRSCRVDGPGDMGATATIEIDTATDRDARAVFERALEVNKQLAAAAAGGGSGGGGAGGGTTDTDGADASTANVYRGQANYQQFIAKRDTARGNAASGHNRHGPMRAPSNIRTTVRWDYKPDICKDYKETGFCGFGDSCIYMHDRTDYKFGWQLEREMEAHTYGAVDRQDYRVVDSDDEEEGRLPFRCYICRQSFRAPVVTKCGHYFCEQCALAEYAKSKRCFVCGAQTYGVFNVAKELVNKLQRQKNGGGGERAGGENCQRTSSDEDG